MNVKEGQIRCTQGYYGENGKQHLPIATTAGQKNKFIVRIFCIIFTHNK
jgi:hypothetical protein